MVIPAREMTSAGKASIDAEGEVKLPEQVLREVGWKQGDQLWVTIVDGERVILTKRPNDIVAYFAGALTDLYPDSEETRRFLDELRGYGEDADPDTEP